MCYSLTLLCRQPWSQMPIVLFNQLAPTLENNSHWYVSNVLIFLFSISKTWKRCGGDIAVSRFFSTVDKCLTCENIA